MNFELLCDTIREIYGELKDIRGGEVAGYIPQLKCVNPDLFAISICTVNGEQFALGDSACEFCLQSCSKPISYCIARQQEGKTLHETVGYEPSGREFNAFVLNRQDVPHNPMINAGAIMVASKIGQGLEPCERFNILKTYYSKMCGNQTVGFDNSVFLSEKRNADRNTSLAYFMREKKSYKQAMTPEDINATLDLYFQQCSITVTCNMSAVMAATLANGGVCPLTSEAIVSPEVTKDCLSLMYASGLYDYSGEFSFESGLPAKSGVAGAILLVVPGKFGLCCWSPPLDEMGNSFKGIRVCSEISKRLHLHIFDNLQGSTEYETENEEYTLTKFIAKCAAGDFEFVQSMLSKQVAEHGDFDVNKGDYDGRTPLHLAAAEGHRGIVNLLLTHKANVNVRDRWGSTPLSEAQKRAVYNEDDAASDYIFQELQEFANAY